MGSGPSSLASRDQDDFSDDIKAGDVEGRVARRELYNSLGRRGMRRYMSQQPKGQLTDKNIIDYQRNLANDAFNREKEFVGKWTELVLKARETGDTALQKHLISYGRDYIETLSPGMRTLLEPILKAGPFDKQKHTLEKFDELHPAPSITADREAQPLLHAQQLFEQEDWQAQRTHFATGKAGPKRNLIPHDTANGLYAMRDDKGRVSIVNEQSLQIKEFAKKHEVSEGYVLANGGAHGKEMTVNVNGKPKKVRTYTDFMSGETTLETMPGMSPEQYNKHEKDVAEFLSVLISGDEKLMKKHPMAALVAKQEASNETFDTIAPLLKQAYGYNFIKPKEKAGFFSELYDLLPGTGNYVKGNQIPMLGGYVEGDNGTIRIVPGDEMNLKGYRVFYDRDNDVVFNATDGLPLGNYETAIRNIEERESLVIKRKTKREEEEDERKSRRESVMSGISTPSY